MRSFGVKTKKKAKYCSRSTISQKSNCSKAFHNWWCEICMIFLKIWFSQLVQRFFLQKLRDLCHMQYVYSSKTRALKNKKRATTKVVRSIVYDVLQTSWEILPQFSPLWLKGKEEKRPLLLWFFKWLFKIFLSRPWQMELFSYFCHSHFCFLVNCDLLYVCRTFFFAIE